MQTATKHIAVLAAVLVAELLQHQAMTSRLLCMLLNTGKFPVPPTSLQAACSSGSAAHAQLVHSKVM
jgi:hypothetical protein